jgi:hypothetical protein
MNDGYSNRGVIDEALGTATSLYRVPPAATAALLVAGSGSTASGSRGC